MKRGLAEIENRNPFWPSGVEAFLELSEFAERQDPSTPLAGLAETRNRNPFWPSGVEAFLELSEFAERKHPSTPLGEIGVGQFPISINPLGENGVFALSINPLGGPT
jgi:hypothetical protein